MKRSVKVPVALAIAVLALWLLFQVSPLFDPRNQAARRLEAFEARISNLRYFKCAEYTIPEGIHERVFQYLVTDEFRCYFVIRLPDYALAGGYYLNDSYAKTYVMVPPGAEYLVAHLANEASLMFINGERIFEPSARSYRAYNSTITDFIGYPKSLFETFDHWVHSFALRPLTKGATYNITIVIRTNLIRGTPPPKPPSPPSEPTLAQRLKITDVNQLMAYLGFQKCGEYHLEDRENLTVTIPVDPNNGTACYLLLYPKDKSRLLKGELHMRWHRNLTGDVPEWWNGTIQLESIKALLTGNPRSSTSVNPYRAFSQKYYMRGHISGISSAEPGDGNVFVISLRKPEGFPTVNGTLSVEIIVMARVL